LFSLVSPNFLLQTSFIMSYREQFIWQRGVKLAINCYRLTENFPKSELYGLTSQIRRSAVSVPSNIAEGYGRRTQNEYIHFLHIALGSLRELDTQLIISKEVGLASPELFTPVLEEVDRFQGILVSSIQKIKS
jgi:four helix bundle protein